MNNPAVSSNLAHWLTWLAFGWMVATITLGRAWDSYWHATRTFDGFFSPPHLFVYGMSVLNTLLVAWLILVPGVRRHFGPGIGLAPLPFAIPGPLAIVAAGFFLVGFAGLALDNLWHTLFGLNETLWSLPHAMLGWGWLLAALGFVAGLLALYTPAGLPWPAALLLGVLLLGFTVAPLLGPLNQNNTLATVRAVSTIPVLAEQRAAQRTFQIYTHWNLTRAHPLLLPLGALWAGMALALLQSLLHRRWLVLLAVLGWSLLALRSDYRAALALDRIAPVSHDLRAWVPLPLLPATLLVLLPNRGSMHTIGWALAGAVWAGSIMLIWGVPTGWFWLGALSAGTMVLGARIGNRLGALLLEPTPAGVALLTLGVGIGMPLLAGATDLYLRLHTP